MRFNNISHNLLLLLKVIEPGISVKKIDEDP